MVKRLNEDQILAYALLGEAAGEDPTGQAAVVHVINNRAKQSGNSAAYEALKPKQFSSLANLSSLRAKYPQSSAQFQQALQTVQGVKAGTIPDPTNGATFFYANKGKNAIGEPSWFSKVAVSETQIGNHRFASQQTSVASVTDTVPAGQEPQVAANIDLNKIKTPEQFMKQYLGFSETNTEQAKAIKEFIKTNVGEDLDPAKISWCAAMLNASIQASGGKGTGKLTARSFLDWGKGVDKPEIGDIVVLKRPGGEDWQGHVGIFQGFNADGSLKILGANQGDSVSVGDYPASDVLGYRRGDGATPDPKSTFGFGPEIAQMVGTSATTVEKAFEGKKAWGAVWEKLAPNSEVGVKGGAKPSPEFQSGMLGRGQPASAATKGAGNFVRPAVVAPNGRNPALTQIVPSGTYNPQARGSDIYNAIQRMPTGAAAKPGTGLPATAIGGGIDTPLTPTNWGSATRDVNTVIVKPNGSTQSSPRAATDPLPAGARPSIPAIIKGPNSSGSPDDRGSTQTPVRKPLPQVSMLKEYSGLPTKQTVMVKKTIQVLNPAYQQTMNVSGSPDDRDAAAANRGLAAVGGVAKYIQQVVEVPVVKLIPGRSAIQPSQPQSIPQASRELVRTNGYVYTRNSDGSLAPTAASEKAMARDRLTASWNGSFSPNYSGQDDGEHWGR